MKAQIDYSNTSSNEDLMREASFAIPGKTNTHSYSMVTHTQAPYQNGITILQKQDGNMIVQAKLDIATELGHAVVDLSHFEKIEHTLKKLSLSQRKGITYNTQIVDLLAERDPLYDLCTHIVHYLKKHYASIRLLEITYLDAVIDTHTFERLQHEQLITSYETTSAYSVQTDEGREELLAYSAHLHL